MNTTHRPKIHLGRDWRSLNQMTSKATTKTEKTRKILIVEDHPVTRQGLVELLRREQDLTVYGEVNDVRQALASLKPPLPDLIVTSLTAPGKNGTDLIKGIHLQHPGLPILVFSVHDELVFAERLLRAGARGYLMKDACSVKLLEAIRTVLNGEIYLSKKIANGIFQSMALSKAKRKNSEMSALTDREFEVFSLLGSSMSTKEIGGSLCISPKTVETHRLHIREKLKFQSGTDLIKYAMRWGAAHGLV